MLFDPTLFSNLAAMGSGFTSFKFEFSLPVAPLHWVGAENNKSAPVDPEEPTGNTHESGGPAAGDGASSEPLPLTGPCGVCGVRTQYRCARCGVAFFCNRAHQRLGWGAASRPTATSSCDGAASGAGDEASPPTAVAPVAAAAAASEGGAPFGHGARCVARPGGPLRAVGPWIESD